MYIKWVAFVLSISGFFSGAAVAFYSFSHEFPYSGAVGVWEVLITLVFAAALWLIGYDLRKTYDERSYDEE